MDILKTLDSRKYTYLAMGIKESLILHSLLQTMVQVKFQAKEEYWRHGRHKI